MMTWCTYSAYGSIKVYVSVASTTADWALSVEVEGSCVRGVCFPDAIGIPFFEVAVPDASESTYSSFLESSVKVTGPCGRIPSVKPDRECNGSQHG